MAASPSSALATADLPGSWSVVGWIPPDDLAFKDWEAIGAALADVDKSIRWLLGDWLTYGEWKYGEKYAQAVDMTRFNFNRLKDYAWVAGNVRLSARTELLSWTHHKHVAKLDHDEQRRWLALAIENDWTTRQLHDAVNGRHALPEPNPPPEPPTPEPLTTPADYRAARAELDAAPKPQRKEMLEALVETWESASEAAQEQADDVTDLTTCPNCGYSWNNDDA